MEREIKVRKKRFAAFWLAVLLICCLAVPAVAEETQTESTTTSTTTSTTESITESTQTETTEVIFFSGGETETTAATETESDAVPAADLYINNLNGSVVFPGTVVAGYTEFQINYYDYDQKTKLSGTTVAYESTHSVSGYSGTGEPSIFEGWKVAFVEISGQVPVANLYATFDGSRIGKGTYALEAETGYQLGSVQHVSGDSSTYEPGISFYVPTSGSYTFN